MHDERDAVIALLALVAVTGLAPSSTSAAALDDCLQRSV